MDKKSLMIIALSVSITLGLSLAAQSLMAAWTSPTEAPPGGNVDAPLNVGTSYQVKQGGIGIVGITHTSGGLKLQILPNGVTQPTGVQNGQIWMVQ